MAKKKVTFSLEEDLVVTLKMVSTLTSEEQSLIVTHALYEYLERIAGKSGKTKDQFLQFMEDAKVISETLRPNIPGSSSGLGYVGHSLLPGDLDLEKSVPSEETMEEEEKESDV